MSDKICDQLSNLMVIDRFFIENWRKFELRNDLKTFVIQDSLLQVHNEVAELSLPTEVKLSTNDTYFGIQGNKIILKKTILREPNENTVG